MSLQETQGLPVFLEGMERMELPEQLESLILLKGLEVRAILRE